MFYWSDGGYETVPDAETPGQPQGASVPSPPTNEHGYERVNEQFLDKFKFVKKMQQILKFKMLIGGGVLVAAAARKRQCSAGRRLRLRRRRGANRWKPFRFVAADALDK